MRKFLIAFLVSILALATVGLPLTVFFVTDTGGLGDKSFNDSAWAGVQMAVQKYGVTANVIQSYEQADYVPNLTAAAQVADVVVAVGFMMQSLPLVEYSLGIARRHSRRCRHHCRDLQSLR